jgi:hypothetical protein
MGDIVNLNKYRKRKAKADREKQADQNRRLHGRTKADRTREDQQKQNLTRGLEGHRLERPADLAAVSPPADSSSSHEASHTAPGSHRSADEPEAHSEETETD